MVSIKEVNAVTILDSRGEKTIKVSIKTNTGDFSASAPQGKSIGKYEVKTYKKDIEEDIKQIKNMSDYFADEKYNDFDDLRKAEDILAGHVGGNTIIALEYAILKAIAKEQKKQVWQIVSDNINTRPKKFPRLVGNVVGGGKHSTTQDSEIRKPDFQEFLLIPLEKPIKAFETNKKAKEKTKILLIENDKNFKSETNDENAWKTSLNEREILDVLSYLKPNIPLGLDIASSGFFSRKKYHYLNPKLDRTIEEQLVYLSSLIEKFDILYIEDPFEENDFEGFAKLLKKFPNRLIVGDDLTVTNSQRLEKAIENKSINAIIIKPNQCGSLIEVKKVCGLAKKNNIKLVFSHRSGETEESILADLAIGFEADFFKCGINGKEREAKLKRLADIEKEAK